MCYFHHCGDRCIESRKLLGGGGHGSARRGKIEEQHCAPIFHGTKFPSSFCGRSHVPKVNEEEKGKKVSLNPSYSVPCRIKISEHGTAPDNVCLSIGLLDLTV